MMLSTTKDVTQVAERGNAHRKFRSKCKYIRIKYDKKKDSLS